MKKKSLEKRVKERTINLSIKEEELSKIISELIKEKNKVSLLLDNMKKAVFAVGEEGVIVSPVSEHCKVVFETEIIGKSVFNTLFKDLSKESIFYSEINFGIVSSIDADCLQFEIAEENLLKKLNI